jgi:hypothetical protein
MSQYINLLGSAFHRQRLVLTLGRAVLLAGIVVIVMISLQMYSQQQVAGLREELASARGLLKAQSAYTDRLKGAGAAQKANAGLAAEVQRLEMELKSARDSMGILEGGAIGNRKGFAAYLQAFSRQAIDGLWLTGFTVGGAGDVAIHGRVVNPELVPAYIQRLNNESALKGREFSVLELRRPQPTAAALAAVAKAGEGARAEAPRYLEFSLTTGNPAEGAPAAGGKP